MKNILSFVLILLFTLTAQAYGLDLQEAKTKGLVGETPTGYLAPVKGGNKEVTALVQTINAKRKQQYTKIAQRNKTSLQSVEQLAGKKAIEKTPAGQYVNIQGKWKKK